MIVSCSCYCHESCVSAMSYRCSNCFCTEEGRPENPTPYMQLLKDFRELESSHEAIKSSRDNLRACNIKLHDLMKSMEEEYNKKHEMLLKEIERLQKIVQTIGNKNLHKCVVCNGYGYRMSSLSAVKCHRCEGQGIILT